MLISREIRSPFMENKIKKDRETEWNKEKYSNIQIRHVNTFLHLL